MRPDIDLNDLITHRQAWRAAIEGMLELAKQGDDSDGANESYWRHELAAFDRTFSIFHDGPDEAPPPEWQDWSGGEGPPADVTGKVVDVAAAIEGDDAGPIWTGPADAADWSDPCRYRLAAEQPQLL